MFVKIGGVLTVTWASKATTLAVPIVLSVINIITLQKKTSSF